MDEELVRQGRQHYTTRRDSVVEVSSIGKPSQVYSSSTPSTSKGLSDDFDVGDEIVGMESDRTHLIKNETRNRSRLSPLQQSPESASKFNGLRSIASGSDNSLDQSAIEVKSKNSDKKLTKRGLSLSSEKDQTVVPKASKDITGYKKGQRLVSQRDKNYSIDNSMIYTKKPYDMINKQSVQSKQIEFDHRTLNEHVLVQKQVSVKQEIMNRLHFNKHDINSPVKHKDLVIKREAKQPSAINTTNLTVNQNQITQHMMNIPNHSQDEESEKVIIPKKKAIPKKTIVTTSEKAVQKEAMSPTAPDSLIFQEKTIKPTSNPDDAINWRPVSGPGGGRKFSLQVLEKMKEEILKSEEKEFELKATDFQDRQKVPKTQDKDMSSEFKRRKNSAPHQLINTTNVDEQETVLSYEAPRKKKLHRLGKSISPSESKDSSFDESTLRRKSSRHSTKSISSDDQSSRKHVSIVTDQSSVETISSVSAAKALSRTSSKTGTIRKTSVKKKSDSILVAKPTQEIKTSQLSNSSSVPSKDVVECQVHQPEVGPSKPPDSTKL